MKRPVLSIVIPTCDRPDTLEVCLRALARQANPDVEIIVQDNASDKRTIDIIRASKDRRIVHHRSEIRLSLRNNFEEGVVAASGDYISIIGDDDAYCAGALDWIVAMLKEHRPIALRWHLAAYVWPSLSDANIGYFHFHYEKFYGGWSLRDSKDLSETMLAGKMSGLWESLQIYHGVVSRQLYEETKRRTNNIFFQYHIPDVYVHTAMLLIAGKRSKRQYIDVSHPLSIYGMSGHSNGNSWFAARAEDRGDKSPMASWERAAASDKQVKLSLQEHIRCVKYHDYAALMLADQLGLVEGKTIDHQLWHQSIVQEVSENPWQFRGFAEAAPVLDYEKTVIGRVLKELNRLAGENHPPPNRLKKLYDECWRWHQLCLVSAAPGEPDDVETAVTVLDALIDQSVGLRRNEDILPALTQKLQKALRLEVKDIYDSRPPVQLPDVTADLKAAVAAGAYRLNQMQEVDAGRLKLIEELKGVAAERSEQLSKMAVTDAGRLKLIEDLKGVASERSEQLNQMAVTDAGRLELIDELRNAASARAEQVETMALADAGRVKLIEDLKGVAEERAGQVNQLAAVDAGRVKLIEELKEVASARASLVNQMVEADAVRADQVIRMLAIDADRVKVIEELSAKFSNLDGLSVTGRNLSFLHEPGFSSAWQTSKDANAKGWPQGVPDVRWRANIALWAARNGLGLRGDFVECGVHTGLLSLVICHALDFASQQRKFYLFDTYNGIPLEGLEPSELERIKTANHDVYRDVWQAASENFSPFPNARLVRGILPGSLSLASINSIAYLSVDLNNAQAEHGVITALWDKLTPGAVVLIDDYIWQGCEPQYDMWNDFARQAGVHIVALPTGQGLIIKPRPGALARLAGGPGKAVRSIFGSIDAARRALQRRSD